MINASEAKANVENYIRSTLDAKLDELNYKITEFSKRGETSLQFTYDEDMYYEVIEKIIKILHDEHGYVVNHNTEWRYLLIKWD